jgi:ribosome-interacting GTPase 1
MFGMSTVWWIAEMETEMAKTQKNKAASHHLGLLEAKLAKPKRETTDASSKKGGGVGEGFDVAKSSDSRIGPTGFPSAGKSTPPIKLIGTSSKAAAHEFTTPTCVPGAIRYKGAKI